MYLCQMLCFVFTISSVAVADAVPSQTQTSQQPTPQTQTSGSIAFEPGNKLFSKKPTKKKKGKKKKAKEAKEAKEAAPSSGEQGTFSKLLPLGLPQFLGGSALWGAVYGLGQAAAVGYGIMSYMNHQSITDAANAQIEIMQTEANKISSSDEDALATAREEIDDFRRVEVEKADSAYTMSLISGAVIFPTLWLVSSIHAFMASSAPTDKTINQRKKKRKKRIRRSEIIEHSRPMSLAERATFFPIIASSGKDTAIYGLGLEIKI